jgi:hypothetical protein
VWHTQAGGQCSGYRDAGRGRYSGRLRHFGESSIVGFGETLVQAPHSVMDSWVTCRWSLMYVGSRVSTWPSDGEKLYLLMKISKVIISCIISSAEG